jgi:hypothetical protein
MASLDINKFELTAEYVSVSLTSGSPTTMPIGPLPLALPVGVVLCEVAFAPGERITNYSWAISGNQVTVTPTFSASVTRQATVALLYPK